jgi:hypothetical protein
LATGLAELDYVVLLPPAERCVAQVAGRPDHPFTDEAATRKMHDEFSAATVDARHVLTDLPERPEDLVDRVVEGMGRGTFSYRFAG